MTSKGSGRALRAAGRAHKGGANVHFGDESMTVTLRPKPRPGL
jgi:hypothetical protein